MAALLAVACDLPHEPGPQPTAIIDTEFKPGLNIMGVLRMDENPGASFIYIERAFQLDELDMAGWEEFSTLVEDAEAIVQGTTDTITYPFEFATDTLRPQTYTHPYFRPAAGEEYALTITHPDFPALTDTTVVPVHPEIAEDTVVVLGQTVSFLLLPTSDTYLYDLYLLSPSDSIHYRLINIDDGEEIPILFNVSAQPGDIMEVHLYGYDANLADYLTSLVSLKPQSYHETVTTVTGGYGVFGAVSVSKFTFTR